MTTDEIEAVMAATRGLHTDAEWVMSRIAQDFLEEARAAGRAMERPKPTRWQRFKRRHLRHMDLHRFSGAWQHLTTGICDDCEDRFY